MYRDELYKCLPCELECIVQAMPLVCACVCVPQGPLNVLMDKLAGSKWPGVDAAGHTNDLQAQAHAHVNVLAGACLALGLKYAGSASTRAYNVLRGCISSLLAAKKRAPDATPAAATGPLAAAMVQPAPPTDAASAAAAVAAVHRLDKGHLEGALDVVVLALSLVMAGTGGWRRLCVCAWMAHAICGTHRLPGFRALARTSICKYVSHVSQSDCLEVAVAYDRWVAAASTIQVSMPNVFAHAIKRC